MAAVPVAQPYWKQAVPSAFTPTAFNSLSPEEKEQEKKKMGCCASCCCCLLIIIIVSVVLAGGALALGTACANDEVCAYKATAEKAGKYDPNSLTTNAAKEFESTATDIDIQVTRGVLTLEAQGTGGSKASVVNSGYDQNEEDKKLFDKNDFEDVEGVFTSKYEKSGTGLNDCLYCRLSDITLTPGAGLNDVKLVSSTDMIVTNTLTVGGDVKVDGEYGGVDVTGALTSTGGKVEIVSTFGSIHIEAAVTGENVRVATDAGSLTAEAAISATDNLEVYGGAGVLSTLEHSFKGLSGGNVTIKANSKSTTTLDGPVDSTDGVWVNAWFGGAKIVSTAAGAISTAAGQVKFYGAGFLEMAGAISASDVVVRADPSADFAFDSVDFTGELKVRSVGGKVAMGVTCGTDKLNVTVTYKVAEGKKSSSGFSFMTKAATPVDLWAEGDITTSNKTGTAGTTNHVDYFEACADGAGGTKQVMVNLNAALGAEVALTEL